LEPEKRPLRFFELACVLVRFDFVASCIVNANHGVMLVDCVADWVWLAVPQATGWQRIGNQIDLRGFHSAAASAIGSDDKRCFASCIGTIAAVCASRMF